MNLSDMKFESLENNDEMEGIVGGGEQNTTQQKMTVLIRMIGIALTTHELVNTCLAVLRSLRKASAAKESDFGPI